MGAVAAEARTAAQAAAGALREVDERHRAGFMALRTLLQKESEAGTALRAPAPRPTDTPAPRRDGSPSQRLWRHELAAIGLMTRGGVVSAHWRLVPLYTDVAFLVRVRRGCLFPLSCGVLSMH